MAARLIKRLFLKEKPRSVKPMELRFREDSEVPLVCITDELRIRAPRPFSTKGLIHADVAKYEPKNVLNELYSHFQIQQGEGKGKIYKFGEVRHDPLALKSLEKLGFLLLSPPGLCCVRDEENVEQQQVVIDPKVIKAKEALCSPVRSEMHRVWREKQPYRHWCFTGYTLWTVPVEALEERAYEVRACREEDYDEVWERHWMVEPEDRYEGLSGIYKFIRPDENPEPYRNIGEIVTLDHAWFVSRKLKEGLNRQDAEGLASNMKMEVAVEIDRSLINMGNLVFFVPPSIAKTPSKVRQEIIKHGYMDMQGLRLARHPFMHDPWHWLHYNLFRLIPREGCAPWDDPYP